MKKYFIFAAAAVVAASCAKTPVPVQTPDGPEVPSVEGREAVQFGSNLIANVETKANGSVDAWGGQDLYIYGLKRIKVGDGSKSLFKSKSGYTFIDNVKAAAPASGIEGALEVKKDNDNGEGEYFYYEGTSTYNFFGYYVDDAYKIDDSPRTKPTPIAQELNASRDSAFVLPIKINGGQDIMLAKASAKDAFDKVIPSDKKTYWTNNGQDWTEENSTWLEKYAFSAYSARRKVKPYLVFEHQLAQIQFNVKSGTTFTDAQGTVSPQLYIKSVEFIKVNTTADLYIASSSTEDQYKEGIHNEGNQGTIAVTEAEGTGDPASVKRVKLDPVKVPNKDAKDKIGAPTMLFPAGKYEVNIVLAQDGTQDQTITCELDPTNIKVKDGESWITPDPRKTSFEAGYKYNVIVTVYGLEKIDVTVELEKWEDGGKADIDTDEKPEF